MCEPVRSYLFCACVCAHAHDEQVRAVKFFFFFFFFFFPRAHTPKRMRPTFRRADVPGRPAPARHLTRARATTPASTPGPVIAVVGGGAAGLAAAFFAATTAGATNARVLILERNPECGKKILISGGTRCNALPAVPVPPDGGGGAFHHAGRPAALRGVLGSWTVDACRAWLAAEAGIDLVEEAGTAKLFPAVGAAGGVRDGLVAAAARAGADVRVGARVVRLERRGGGAPSSSSSSAAAAVALDDTPPPWCLTLESGATLHAHAVILATGGLSYPGLGATGDGLGMAAGVGHTLAQPHPALAPLLGSHPGGGVGGLGATHLAGLAVRTATLFVQEEGKKKRVAPLLSASPRSDFLFTHRGFSGPAILDASHHLSAAFTAGRPPPALVARWVKEMGPGEWGALLAAAGGAPVSSCLKGRLPARLVAALLADAGIAPDQRAAELNAGDKDRLAGVLGAYPLAVTGVDGGWGKAEVTAGGVPLAEVEARTLESTLAPGLHVCGELLAPAGRLGGFNFYWAWAGGRVAGVGAVGTAVRAWEESRRG